MIAINITLLFQAIHFFIAYLIIRFLILKPLLIVIQQEQRERDVQLAALQQIKEQVAANEQEKQNTWMRFKHYFAGHMPSLGFSRHNIPTPSVTIVPVNSEELQHDIAKITAALVKEGEK